MIPANSREGPTSAAPRGLMAFLSRPITLFPLGLSQTPRQLLHEASLPAPITDLIQRVTRRTRLWPGERLDVTRELIAHFRDALEAGRSPDDLVRGFGEPADAARLIRRAKKRCRPAAWRAAVRTLQAALLLLALIAAIYSFAAARAFMSHPTIARNFLEELNAPIAKLPDADRAWPLYRAAYLALPPLPKALEAAIPNVEPADERWPIATDYLAACDRSLELIRQASTKPALGRPLSTAVDVEVEIHSQVMAGIRPDEARKLAEQAAAALADPNPPLVNLLLPHLGHARHFARILALDIRAAVHENDNTRAAADLEAMFRLSAHMSDNAFLIGGLVELAINALACETLSRILGENPSLFTDEQLASLAHLAARDPSPISFQGEVLGLDDILQRVYSDDGQGDGHLTVDGARLLRSYLTSWSPTARTDPWHGVSDKVRDALEVPFDSLVGASRKETHEVYTRLIDRAVAYASLPPWNRPDLSPDAEFEQFLSSGGRSRYPLVWILMPALSRAVWAKDEAAQPRGALLIAISLELHKRRHATYPNTLAEIPISLLAQTPLDMFDGKPLRYTLRDAKPVIYSVGPDRKDDQGRSTARDIDGSGVRQWMSAAQYQNWRNSQNADAVDGDWILWPPAPRKPTTTDAQ